MPTRNSMRRSGGYAGVALDHAGLHLDGAAHRVDHAAELDDRAVAGALDDAAVMRGDGGIDQIAPQSPEPRQRAFLVGAGEPAVADDIRDQDRRELPGSRHDEPSGGMQNSTKIGEGRPPFEGERASRRKASGRRVPNGQLAGSNPSSRSLRDVASTPSSVPTRGGNVRLTFPLCLSKGVRGLTFRSTGGP